MKHFDHPNVLHLIGVCLDAGPAPYVVMPYMANGSLLHYLKKERDNIVLQVGGDDDVVRTKWCQEKHNLFCLNVNSKIWRNYVIMQHNNIYCRNKEHGKFSW